MHIRRSEERGRFDWGWLDTRHTFSFGDYYDPAHMGFRALRVINEDRVQPGQGFGAHGHRDMEIVSYVISGGLGHKDSMGNGSVIRPGEVQRMSAGTGVRHSEMNASKTEPVHFLQIWLLPKRRNDPPGYEQRAFPDIGPAWRVVASPDGADGAVTIHSDARLLAAKLTDGQQLTHTTGPRYAWLHVVTGAAEVNGVALGAGDAAAYVPGETVEVKAGGPAELLLFDLD